MITWMQKHKKWLVITIWISAIAFIGAGMVGFGSYGFGLNNDRVARVGNIDIDMPRYQQAYSDVMAQFAQMSQVGVLDEAQAKQLGIPQMALSQLIQQTQLLNFAHDLGLMVSDSEVAQGIIDAKVYVDEAGNFSKEVYERALRERNLSKSAFEEIVRDMLLLQKLYEVMNLKSQYPTAAVTPIEIASVAFANSIKDHLMIKILPLSEVKLSYDEKDLRAFWETNAHNWKTPMEFKIEYILTPYESQNPSDEELKKHYEDFKSDYLDPSGHLMSFEESHKKLLKDVRKVQAESASKREYRDLKNGSKQGEIVSIKENEGYFGTDSGIDLVVEDLKVAQVGQILKPIETAKGFVTLKLLEVTPSVNQSFEEARESVKVAYEEQKKKEALSKQAQEILGISSALQNPTNQNLANQNLEGQNPSPQAPAAAKKPFNGTDVGFVDRFYNQAIPGLSQMESAQLLEKLFSSSEKEGYIMGANKAILYRVLSQKADFEGSGGESVPTNILLGVKNIKTMLVLDALSEYLNETYKTTIYVDVSK